MVVGAEGGGGGDGGGGFAWLGTKVEDDGSVVFALAAAAAAKGSVALAGRAESEGSATIDD